MCICMCHLLGMLYTLKQRLSSAAMPLARDISSLARDSALAGRQNIGFAATHSHVHTHPATGSSRAAAGTIALLPHVCSRRHPQALLPLIFFHLLRNYLCLSTAAIFCHAASSVALKANSHSSPAVGLCVYGLCLPLDHVCQTLQQLMVAYIIYPEGMHNVQLCT